MGIIWLPNFQIAVGNNNAAGLTVWESITPTGARSLPPLQIYSRSNPGEFIVRGNGLLYQAGFQAQQLVAAALQDAQYFYLKTTYCSGGYSGLVTVKTALGGTSYANYNAVLTLAKEVDMSRLAGGFRDVPITLSRLVAI